MKHDQDLRDEVDQAESFREAMGAIVDAYSASAKQMQSQAKNRRKGTVVSREAAMRSAQDAEAVVRHLQNRLKVFEKHQADKKLPASLRKQLAATELELLKAEYGHVSDLPARSRHLKKELAALLDKVDRLKNPPKKVSTTNRTLKVGNVYPKASITRAYDGYVWTVLVAHFEFPTQAKGQRTGCKVVAALPENAEYLEIKKRHFTSTLELLIVDAYSSVGELGEEMREAFDNTPEGLRGSDIGEARAVAAAQLEEICSDCPAVPEKLSSLKAVYYPSTKLTSRADRAFEVAAVLKFASEQTRLFIEANKLRKTELQKLTEFQDRLDSHADRVENVEFPGMFG